MKVFDFQVKSLIINALNEDIGGFDITTDAIVCNDDPYVECEVIAKEESIVCGLDIFALVFKTLFEDGRVMTGSVECCPATGNRGHAEQIVFLVKEGEKVSRLQKVISIKAKASIVLSAERTALNFIQHLSGIASAANLAVKELRGLKTKVLDTRKTIPGLRILQKYAVKVGGAENHRFDLSSGILIKDNHIKLAGGIKNALNLVRSGKAGFNQKIEIETNSIDEVLQALEGKADIIMLDNMNINEMQEAVKLVNGNALVEASGNITINNLREISEKTGVDYISMGSLTNAIRPADFSLNFNGRVL
jgi:nicotinate-nucleotide pyrophosphorylase